MINYIVYELWNTITNSPFYVGFSKRSTRPYQHIKSAFTPNIEHKKGANAHKIFTIRQIYKHGATVEVKIVFSCMLKEDAIAEEIRLIKHYGRRDTNSGILTNMTDGGEGTGSRIYGEVERNKRKLARLGKTFDQIFGKEHADIIKSKISKFRSGHKTGKPSWNNGYTKHTHLSVKKISDSKKGKEPYNKGIKMKDINKDYKNHFLGKIHSLDAKKKISKANKGKCAGSNNPMYGKSAVKGRKWYHNNITQFYLFPDNPLISNMSLIPGRLKLN